jgi:hypothetical protein
MFMQPWLDLGRVGCWGWSSGCTSTFQPVLAVEVSRLRLGGDVRIKWPGVLSGMPVL